MNSAIEKIGDNNCTGCYGCYNKCKIDGAIKMELTNDGFYKPVITDNCIGCGQCQEACPVIIKINNNKKEEIKAYAAWSKDDNILMNSSSGGIFSEIAKYFLENKGIVFGAKWYNGEVKHCSISNLKNLSLLQKSKYLQSRIDNSYNEVKEYLDNNKKVLFVGTPCEVAALRTIVNHKNLYIIDFVCHGIPSYKAYEKYVAERFNSKINEIETDFRNKESKGWKIYYIYSKCNKYKNTIKEKNNENDFFRGFLKNIYLNKSCYNCEFRTMPRYGDITLADFWGVPKDLENFKGTSALIINNSKGKEIIEAIKNNIVLHKTSYETILKGNPCLENYKMDDSKREEFFYDIENFSFKELSKKYFKFPNKYIYFIRRVLSFVKRRIIKGV